MLDSKIEAILFFRGEPVKKSELAKILQVKESEIEEACKTLRAKLDDRGVRLIDAGGLLSLGTSPEASSLIEQISKEEIERELSKASLETLSIILYQGPVSRGEIDFIRGVNSSFILRSLLIRGLVNREVDPNDKRTFIYSPSTELLSHLGISSIDELPKYEEVRERVVEFKKEFSPGEEE